MATKKQQGNSPNKIKGVNGEPKFPYTLTPSSLRKLLGEIPNRTKPPKLNRDTLKAWGYMNTNDQYNLRVLKSIGLISESTNEPTQMYTDFMSPTTGPIILGKALQSVYAKLFETVLEPAKASNEDLKRFFNVYSGGSEETIRLQMETFKALASYATFGSSDVLERPDLALGNLEHSSPASINRRAEPSLNISLHIHLPENKTKTEYEAIIDRIAEKIFKTDL